MPHHHWQHLKIVVVHSNTYDKATACRKRRTIVVMHGKPHDKLHGIAPREHLWYYTVNPVINATKEIVLTEIVVVCGKSRNKIH